jgi:cytidylate kinase
MIITIDGPSGTGKSSAAKLLALALGFLYFDTGAMYRALAYLALEREVELQDALEIEQLLAAFDFRVQVQGDERRYLIGSRDVTQEIRTPLVAHHASLISAIAQVRTALIGVQHEAAKRGDVVFEGRDMGTIVFPQADKKFFLTARPEVRAARRYRELKEKQPHLAQTVTLAQVLEDQAKRDQRDIERTHSPLRPAGDALVIDTSEMNLNQVVQVLLNACKV